MDVFCLVDSEGKLLPPSVQATVLAKYSRSPLKARELLAELSEIDADKFQEKWVIGYGHSSVSELAVAPICMEGISIVASKFVESWPRGGYSEKSTRYQLFSRDSFVTPPGAPSTMKEFASRFYDAYERLQEPCLKRCAELMGKDPNDSASLTDRLVKARTFDNLRYLLPAGTGTNVACVLNMRDIRGVIVQARGHNNPEIKLIGDKVHDAVQVIAQSLVKHTEPESFELPIRNLGSLPNDFDFDKPNWFVELHRPHLLPEPSLTQKAFESTIAERHGMGWSGFCRYMESRGPFQDVPKVFSTVRISFDVMMDYGAYRDLQRHRRCEQYPEFLTPNYGYLVPDDLVGTEMESEYRKTMDSLHKYEDENVIHDSDLMQYMIPLGYLHRCVFEMDLRELYYIAELRTKPQGHISYRRIAYEMYDLTRKRLPDMMQWCRVQKPDSIGDHT